MPFKLTIIGSGSAVPTVNRGVTSQYVNFNERHILIDCGEGTQLQLRRFKVKFQRLKMILISHLHGDHYLGLVGLLSSMSLLGRTQKLLIICPKELEQLLNVQFEIAGIKLNFELEFKHLTAKDKTVVFEDNVIAISAFPVKHRIDCWGFYMNEQQKEKNVDPRAIKEHGLTIEEILQAKKGEDIVREAAYYRNEDITLPPEPPISYAYSADTMYFDKMAEYVKDASILYHEATFTEKQIDRAKATMHSTAKQAATVAKNANVGKLILGHFSARFRGTDEVLAEAKTVFDKVVCVEDGDEFIL
ncbi:ribonuclease Z [Paracrocinitomix mangrovi]|uniref:ribonuclease Z n=1 Tax=Paracrocinitomix mangrovi TaxID=2862509 RepID=UPI001C8D7292|nr:ribonuclease Z [Paracrocinitomix mangrovi]UKN01416.1 ribonuclease Z [Paracrocinitomix mangrovi]